MGEMERLTGMRIKYRLNELGMKQKELAEKAKVTESAVTRFIQGKRTPTLATGKRIADALEVKIGYLVGEEE